MTKKKNEELPEADNHFAERVNEKMQESDKTSETREKVIHKLEDHVDSAKAKAKATHDKINEKIDEEKDHILPLDKETGTKDFLGKAAEKIQEEKG